MQIYVWILPAAYRRKVNQTIEGNRSITYVCLTNVTVGVVSYHNYSITRQRAYHPIVFSTNISADAGIEPIVRIDR